MFLRFIGKFLNKPASSNKFFYPVTNHLISQIIRKGDIMNIRKVVIFSSLVSMNVVIWYEILGTRFMIALFLAIAYLVLSPGKSKRSKGGRL